ncbi:MAG TPA: hypothetical protein VFQ45_08775, partial [Longimicrobium sp.]|nr:hypothetical protein [Longimicrobium sp.]
MSAARDPGLRGLDDCGCCAGAGASVPVAVENRPGLPAVAYRVGTHATFLEHLLASLSARGGRPADAPPGWTPPLRALSAREDDFTPALLDAWAAVGDVLTFYQERIANESWLRTATERVSVLRLARALGYEPAPGVAAATALAFTLEEGPGAPARVPVPAGTRVQSVPGPDERPQTFETTEAVEARPEWNAWKARPTRPQALDAATAAVWVAGAPAPVAAGDLLLFVGAARPHTPGSRRWALRAARAAVVDAEGGRTRVELDAPLGTAEPTVAAADAPALYVLRARAALFGQAAPDWNLLPEDVRAAYPPPVAADPTVPPPPRTDWPGLEPGVTTEGGVDLDAVYPRLLAGGWLVMADPEGPTALYRVERVEETGRSAFGLSTRVSRPVLDVKDADELRAFPVRRTLVYLQSEALPLAEEPDPAAVQGRTLELDCVLDALPEGRRLVVRGRTPRVRLAGGGHVLRDAEGRTVAALPDGAPLLLLEAPATAGGLDRLRLRDAEGREGFATVAAGGFAWLPAGERDPVVAEEAVLERREAADAAHTRLVLRAPLRHAYDRAGVEVLGNVAPATHGERVADEVLGGGDAGLSFQRFALRQPPLTHVADASPSGTASTLEVRVNEVRWREVPTLFGRGPQERVYATRLQDGGATVLQFGDGREGARLPTGHENVRASYRRGIGREGNLAAGQLSLLITRPLGVRAADNPLPATGGTDAEAMDDARARAPLTVLTLDR